jgi:hypothetical protein
MSEQQAKEWWQQGFGYRLQGGNVEAGKEVSYSMITDEGTGFCYYKTGDYWNINDRSSVDICGMKLNDKEVAKLIYAENGDIEIRAPGGQITLLAKNIRLLAEDGSGEITLQAGKILETDAPTARVKGTNVDITAVSGAQMIGSYVDASASTQTTISSLTDVTQGSLVGTVLNVLGNVKKYLEYFA